jgi:hypothetical protein
MLKNRINNGRKNEIKNNNIIKNEIKNDIIIKNIDELIEEKDWLPYPGFKI